MAAVYLTCFLMLFVLPFMSCDSVRFARDKKDDFEDFEKVLKDHIKEAKKELEELLLKEGKLAKECKKLEGKLKGRAFRKVQKFLETTKSAKKFFYAERIVLSCVRHLIKHYKGKFTRKQILKRLKDVRLDLLDDDDPRTDCPFRQETPCRQVDKVNVYRTIDGSCNNLANPLWGRSFTPLTRDVSPEYDDGVSSPRVTGELGKPLPSPRAVVIAIHTDVHVPDALNSVALMTYGQIVDHDLSHTAITKVINSETGETEDIVCGEDGCSKDIKGCFPIEVDSKDPRFYKKNCLEFVRSMEVTDLHCTMGPRQNLNQITSYLDANFVYGSTQTLADNLREKNEDGSLGPKLRTQKHPEGLKALLPPQKGGSCVDTDESVNCFLAGDARANEQCHLTVTHTIFVREHNRIVDALAEQNPHWDDERLFQEARRILIAEVQMIDYNEYLPIVMGEKHMKDYDLKLLKKGYFTKYEPKTDASTSNSFTTATFRFAHGTIPSVVKRADKHFDLHTFKEITMAESLFRAAPLYDTSQDGIDGLIRGFITQKSEDNDQYFSEEMSARLFSDNPENPSSLGTDLASINIQRGRDHGIPGYNAFREFCGLKRVKNFKQLGKVLKNESLAETYRKLYSHINDIDFFSAGIAEPKVKGSLLGETFLCHIGKQFRKYRYGDRFWFEGNVKGTYHFTLDQLDEIRKVSFAKILCINGDDIKKITPSVLRVRSKDNDLVDCKAIPDIDFKKWKEGNSRNDSDES